MKSSFCSIFLIALLLITCSKQENTIELVRNDKPDLSETFQYNFKDNNNLFLTGEDGKASTIQLTSNMAILGRVLFYDQKISLNNTVSCGSCHKQVNGFADNIAKSIGLNDKLTVRNTLSLANVRNSRLFWDMRGKDLVSSVMMPVKDHIEMGMEEIKDLPAKLAKEAYYQDLFEKAYGKNAITVQNISISLAAFVFSLNSSNSAFDKEMDKKPNSLSALEKEGRTLFEKKYNCTSCHGEVAGSNSWWGGSRGSANIGLSELEGDIGSMNITKKEKDRGIFAVPSLRNIAITGPYMHDGRFTTLDEVLDHYSHGIRDDDNLDVRLTQEFRDHPEFFDSWGGGTVVNPNTPNAEIKLLPDGSIDTKSLRPAQFNISAEDKRAIIAFLNSFTDYTFISDKIFSDPFYSKK